MDVHRCRFVPYQPSAINAIAFSHPTSTGKTQAKIARAAIGRANGDIEIWNPLNGLWHQELVIRGGKDRSIDGLVWVNEPDQHLGDRRVRLGRSRLFSIGYTSTVTEWDLEKGTPKRHASGQHGDIWCIAAQPSKEDGSQDSGKLVAGTIDGELVMYTTEDEDLRFQRTMVRSPTKKAQFVSICFQSSKVAIVGCSDSTLRAYDVGGKGAMLRRMTLGADLVSGSKEIITWSVKCLRNGNIVSGDSTGQLTIWDGKTFTQMQRIQGHKQDILSLAVSSTGKSILSGGMDRRTVLYKLDAAGGNHRWSKAWGRRYHDHDVKSMASFESSTMSVVLSGGPDSNTVILPLKEIGRENHRMVSSLPQQPPIASASKARFIVSWWDRTVHIWVLRRTASDIFKTSSGEDVDLNKERKLLKTLVVKGDSNISDATINEDGTLLFVSTATNVKAFKVEHEDPLKPSDVKLSGIDLPPRLAEHGASRLQLAPDDSWLCLVREGLKPVVAKVERTEETYTVAPQSIRKLRRLNRKIPLYLENGGLGKYDRNISQIAFSPDSRMLAIADLAGYIDTWVLQSREQSGKEADGDASSSDSSSSDEETASDNAEVWTRNPSGKLLPKLPVAPVVLSFSDDVPGTDNATDYTLLTITAAWGVWTFHPLQGSLTTWAKRNPRKNFPAPILDLIDFPKGAIWQGSRVWIYGVSFLVMIDLSQNLPTLETDPQTASLKRKRTNHASGAGGKSLEGNLKPHQIVKHNPNGQDEDVAMSDAARDIDSSDSDDDSNEKAADDNELERLRKTEEQNGDGAAPVWQPRKAWWMTYKYRPIFGVVKMGTDEVALVERPMWDVEMPERFYAGEEWERQK